MLVLSRREHEAIVINESITITVEAIRGGVIKLSIEAPVEVPIRRAELEPRKAA